MMKRIASVALFGFFIATLPVSVLASDTRFPDLRIYDVRHEGKTAVRQESFHFLDGKSPNGGSVTLGNVTGDAQQEIIVAAGPGSEPYIQIYTAKGRRIAQFLAYDKTMKSGVHVASGNINAAGYDEIVTVPGYGSTSLVKIFNGKGKQTINNGFYAFPKSFTGGSQIAVGNVRGSDREEIIVGNGAGTSSYVRVFNHKGKVILKTILPFDRIERGGVSVTTANVDGGAHSEIAIAQHAFGKSNVKVYKVNSGSETILSDFYAYEKSYRGGVNLAAADIDQNGTDEIITVARQGRKTSVRFFKGHGTQLKGGFRAYEADFMGGAAIAAGNADADNKPEIITVPEKKVIQGRTDYYKYIDIDLSEQKLRAYKNGVLEKEFLVSTGVERYATPQGTFPIRRKIFKKDYKWEYGPEHPDNYDIKDVPYNLQFLPTYYLHNAFWHNNFGHPMSHGCVNINLENSKWIYEWAQVGDPVIIHP
jgi:lipoprotein-anchoring transpeptidase ErfK/SrfK